MSPLVKDALKVGLPLVLAVVAYLLQVDPISLCPKTAPTVTVQPAVTDAGL